MLFIFPMVLLGSVTGVVTLPLPCLLSVIVPVCFDPSCMEGARFISLFLSKTFIEM